MVHNEDELDQLTQKLIKQTRIDEPSGTFTDRVMQSVLAVSGLEEETRAHQKYWLLFSVLLIMAGGWYLATWTGIMINILEYIESIKHVILAISTGLTGFFQNIEFISGSPTIQIGSLAVLFLLLIETFLTRKKYQV